MSEVKLLKRKDTYVDKEGNEKSYTNFYVNCGDTLVPVQVCYFENEEGRDPQYAARRAVLSAFAETMPDRPPKAEPEDKPVKAAPKTTAKSNLKPMSDDETVPF